MAESVIPVEGVAITANAFDNIFVALAAALGYNPATQAVIRTNPFGRNTLAVTGAASPVAVASGDAIVNGKLYTNTASKNITVSTPSTSTRIDRVVLRIDYTATPMTCTAVLLAGAEGGAAPALTQTDGTTWEVSLAQVSITTGGVITLTDERGYVGDLGILTAAIAANAVTEAKIATSVAGNGLTGGGGSALAVGVDDTTIEINSDALRVKAGGLSAAHLTNRTRFLWVPPTHVYNSTTPGSVARTSAMGFPMADSKVIDAYGDFVAPSDFVSGCTATPIVVGAGSGAIYATGVASYGGYSSQTYNTHSNSVAAAAFSMNGAGAHAQGHSAISLSSLAADDLVHLFFERDATNGADTENATVYFCGWLVSYTADM